MRNNMYNSPFSLLYLVLGAFLLIYFWLPLFIVLFVGILIFAIISYIFDRLNGSPSNFNVKIVRMRPNQYNQQQSNDIDCIDSTTADKDEKK